MLRKFKYSNFNPFHYCIGVWTCTASATEYEHVGAVECLSARRWQRTARRYIGIKTNSLSKGRKDIQHVPSTGKIRTVGTFEFWVPKRQSLGGVYCSPLQTLYRALEKPCERRIFTKFDNYLLIPRNTTRGRTDTCGTAFES